MGAIEKRGRDRERENGRHFYVAKRIDIAERRREELVENGFFPNSNDSHAHTVVVYAVLSRYSRINIFHKFSQNIFPSLFSRPSYARYRLCGISNRVEYM